MSFLYSGSLWSSLYCGVSSLCVGLYRWLVKVSWLGKLVSMFWWMELYFFSLLSKSWAAFLGAWCPLPAFRSGFVEFTRRLNALLMNLWGRKCSPHPTPPPSWLLPLFSSVIVFLSFFFLLFKKFVHLNFQMYSPKVIIICKLLLTAISIPVFLSSCVFCFLVYVLLKWALCFLFFN